MKGANECEALLSPTMLLVGYDVAVNRAETALFVLFASFWVALFGLYHFMIYAANKRLPASNRIPHVRHLGGLRASHGFEWRRVTNDYRTLYPTSLINYMWVGCIGSIVVIAIAFVFLRVWEYTHGQLP
jgi:hypothetical protein